MSFFFIGRWSILVKYETVLNAKQMTTYIPRRERHVPIFLLKSSHYCGKIVSARGNNGLSVSTKHS